MQREACNERNDFISGISRATYVCLPQKKVRDLQLSPALLYFGELFTYQARGRMGLSAHQLDQPLPL
jgi:hypothetical protein